VAKDKLAADSREGRSDSEALLSATTNKAEGEASLLRERIVDRLDAAKARVLADPNFLIGEGYIAKLHDGRLFAQPVLSTQAQAKEEAANEDATEEK